MFGRPGLRTTSDPHLSTADVAHATNLAETTLRMWESRYGFPSPARLPSGHRRYSVEDVERLQQILRLRSSGLSLRGAIERVQSGSDEVAASVFGSVRRKAGLSAQSFTGRHLGALLRAVEDEALAGGVPPIIVRGLGRRVDLASDACRRASLARSAEFAVTLACSEPRSPIARTPGVTWLRVDNPLGCERFVACERAGLQVCFAGWEAPGQDELPVDERRYETVWTADPASVRDALESALHHARATSDEPERIAELLVRLEHRPPVTELDPHGLTALVSRMIGYAVGPAEAPRRLPQALPSTSG